VVHDTESIDVDTIGQRTMPSGCQTVYRTELHNNGKDGFIREDIRLAYWTRNDFVGTFHLWILAEDRETRLKLKSIVPVLENAAKPHSPSGAAQ
jgi:hypothetical protein